MTTTKTNTQNTTNTQATDTKIPTSVVVIAGAVLETPIEFRQDKFAKRVDPEFAANLIPIVEEFVQKPRRNALGMLWQLLYNPDRYLDRIGLTLVNIDAPDISDEDREAAKDLLFIQPELWPHFWNELRFQYAKYNIGFPDVETSEGYAEAYKALNDATVKNHVLCAIVLDHCKSMVKSDLDQKLTADEKKAAERAIYLMKSSKDNNVFGGVCSLSFNKKEAEFLKRYAPKISQLLQAMLDDKIARCGVEDASQASEVEASTSNTATAHAEVVAEEDNFNKPFAGLAEKLKEKGFTLPEAPAAESTSSENSSQTEAIEAEGISGHEATDIPEISSLIPDTLTIDVIRQNQEAISTFLTAYKQLEELGIDPAEVIAKSDTIAKAFEVFKAFG